MLESLATLSSSGLIRTQDALRFGLWPALRSAHAAGAVRRIWPGVYLASDAWTAANPERRHLLTLHAVTAARSCPPAFAGRSAAIAWGIPVLQVPSRLEMLRAPGGQRRDDRVRGRLTWGQRTVTAGGLTLVSAADAVVDIASDGGVEPAVVAADAALHAGLASCEQLRAARDSYDRARVKHRGSVAEAVELADGRAESPLESISRVRLMRLGVGPDDIQFEILSERGRRFRVDFIWHGARVIGECDGRVKYGRASNGGEPAEEVVWREKRREDELRAMGYRVCRWTWADLHHPGRLGELVRSALGQQAG